MKSVILKDNFGIENLTLNDTSMPICGPNEILVKLTAASINYIDLLLVKGFNPHLKWPHVPLSDAAGTVVEAGKDVQGFNPGDRVVTTYIPDWVSGRYTPENSRFETRPGSGVYPGQLMEYKTFRPNEILKFPDSLSFAEASTLPIAALTAWNALLYAKAKPGETVLLQGTGGVSIFALQFAKAAGIKAIITSSNDEKLERAKKLGADLTINYRKTPDWPENVLKMTNGEGSDIILETVGGGNFNKSLEALRLEGRISVVGFLEKAQSEINLVTLNLKRATIIGLSVGNRDDFSDMLKSISVNNIKPVIDKIFSLAQIREAFSYMEAGNHFGKIVIEF